MTDTIKLKSVVLEDFVNYGKPSMFLGTSFCDFKCCTERGYDISVCQNSPLVSQPSKDISIKYLYDKYISSDITKAIVIGGMEPFKQIEEVLSLISYFRENGCMDYFVIYTGYNPQEIRDNPEWSKIFNFHYIKIKYGRYVKGQHPHFDNVLGVCLASDNQFAVNYEHPCYNNIGDI